MAYLDRSADPAKDFFRYASGSWVDAHPIPPDKTRWSGFDELRERNFALLHRILEEAARGRSSDPVRRKIGTFYAAAMDSAKRAQLRLDPIAPELARIDSLTSLDALVDVLTALHGDGFRGVFSARVAPDAKKSSIYTLYLEQGGLSLPDRDYYLLSRFRPLRAAYRRHVAKMFVLAGDASARARRSAAAVLALETALARASRRRTDLRDPHRNYNRRTVRQLSERHPHLRWAVYFRGRGVPRVRSVVVGQPEFFDRLDRLLRQRSLADWKAYLRWHLLHDSAPHLSPAFDRENFAFFHRRLLGQERPEPLWKRSTTLVDEALGEALGKLYVERYFPRRSRARMIDLVREIRRVFRARLRKVAWMTPATRRRAIAKFDRFEAMIGHPQQYRSYARVRVSTTDHLGNLRRARAFDLRRRFARIGRPVDRKEWGMTPPTVNAYFAPTQNEIVFPAGILQPPFFDPKMDDPINFGGIATVIGHEITHGYDDQGRKYDDEGNLRDWWSPTDARQFRRRAQRIIDQYSRFQPLPGLPLNGALTAGENIADLGGVSLALEALSRRIAAGRTPNRSIGGFTPVQRFFLAYGQIWRGSARPEETRRRVLTDPHSPGQYRANGVVANLPEFWTAFDVAPGSPMRQDLRRQVVIW